MTDTAGETGVELVAQVGQVQPPAPSMGVGSTATLGGVVLAWGAAVTAVVTAVADDPTGWYTDGTALGAVLGLVFTAVVATLGFFAGRTSQQNTITRERAGTADLALAWIEDNVGTLDELVAELREQRGKVVAYVPVPGAPSAGAGDDAMPEPDDVDRTVTG